VDYILVMTRLVPVFASLVFSCVAADDTTRIEVEDNSLGITSIAFERTSDDGASRFDLRGLDGNDVTVARVQLNVGAVDGLSRYFPGRVTGSEIILSRAGADDQHVFSRETEHFQLPAANAPAVAAFLELPSVTRVLAREARIAVQPAPSGERGYWTYPCSGSLLNTSPVAQQCCWTNAPGYAAYTDFYSGSTGAIVLRYYGATYSCAGQYGEACSGAACFWGPNGFSRPSMWVGSGTPRIFTFNDDWACTGNWYTSDPPAVQFADATGTFPTGQGCPGGNDTGAGDWDY